MINRSKVNKNQVSAQDSNRSGFNLSYNSYNDFILGRVHVSGYHYVMPASKFSGHNKGDFMFNLVGTEFVAPIDGSQFNVAVSCRSIDNTFEDAFAPSKNNDMSNNWRVPTVSINEFIRFIVDKLGLFDANTGTDHMWLHDFMSSGYNSLADVVSSESLPNTWIDSFKSLKFDTATEQLFEQHYMSDILQDYYDYAHQLASTLSGTTSVGNARYILCMAYLKPFIGESSLMDELGYIIVRNEDFNNLLNSVSYTFLKREFADVDDFADSFDSSPQNEYLLRGYYAIWYQLLRDPNLEPVSSTLPKWKQFGSTSVISLPMLLHRCHSWYEDLFVGGQPDDMMRHVYAPIFQSQELSEGSIIPTIDAIVDFPSAPYDYENSESFIDDRLSQHNLASQTLSWRDPLTGKQRSLQCPLPALVNDSLRSSNSNMSVFGLDLFNLRQAQSLERYLKRNFYFGDEYKERMKAHYGSDVSDYRLNYPTLLSSSLNAAGQERLVNNTATSESVAGTRNVNMTIQTSGDGYESFSEEFAMIFNLISFIPRPQYSGVNGFNLLYRQMDWPVPEFAANNEELSRVAEVSVNGLSKDFGTMNLGRQTFAHHPYAHIWRSRVDEAHGSFRSSRSACLFTRYFDCEENDPTSFPRLNYQFIHCRPNLRMFLNTIRLDGQLTGNVSHDFFCECPLPVPVESI